MSAKRQTLAERCAAVAKRAQYRQPDLIPPRFATDAPSDERSGDNPGPLFGGAEVCRYCSGAIPEQCSGKLESHQSDKPEDFGADM